MTLDGAVNKTAIMLAVLVSTHHGMELFNEPLVMTLGFSSFIAWGISGV